MTQYEKSKEIGKFGHWELDIKSGKLFWSNQVYSIFKLQQEDFTPTYEAFLNVIHPEDREKVNNAYSESLKTKEPYIIEHRLLFEDGSVGYVTEKCDTFYDENDNPIKSIGTIQDITDWVLSSQKLKESEEKFKAISNQTTEGITVADMEGNYVFVNPAFCNMSGYTEEELLSMTVFDMKAPDQDHSSFSDSKEKTSGASIRVKLQRKNGTEYLTEIIGDVITVDNKQLVLGTIRDITEQEKSEQEIKNLNNNLESLVSNRTEELNETVTNLNIEIEQRAIAEERIVDALKTKEILLKEITHRVKNSLQIISSLINLQKSTVTNPESIEMLSQVSHRIQSMALIHETLYKSNEFEQVIFKDYFNSLIFYITKTFDTPNIRIETEIDDITFPLDTATNCGMIIMELITNSIKYAFPKNTPGIISVSLKKQENSEYYLTISDNGIGFPNKKNFKSTKTLGMQIVISLTEQLEAEISLKEDTGTTFEVILPKIKL